MHTDTPLLPTTDQKKVRGPLRSTAHSLVEADAADYLGLSRAFLRQSRRSEKPPEQEPTKQKQRSHHTTGPAYLKIGRAVRYRLPDLDAWLDAHRVSTRDRCPDHAEARR